MLGKVNEHMCWEGPADGRTAERGFGGQDRAFDYVAQLPVGELTAQCGKQHSIASV